MALAAAAILCGAGTAAAQNEKSKGVYRIPYANGTSVRVSRDHTTHTPVGRIDMSGTGGSAYQQEWEDATQAGLLTRAVTGYVDGATVRYAAVWRR